MTDLISRLTKLSYDIFRLLLSNQDVRLTEKQRKFIMEAKQIVDTLVTDLRKDES